MLEVLELRSYSAFPRATGAVFMARAPGISTKFGGKLYAHARPATSGLGFKYHSHCLKICMKCTQSPQYREQVPVCLHIFQTVQVMDLTMVNYGE